MKPLQRIYFQVRTIYINADFSVNVQIVYKIFVIITPNMIQCG